MEQVDKKRTKLRYAVIFLATIFLFLVVVLKMNIQVLLKVLIKI